MGKRRNFVSLAAALIAAFLAAQLRGDPWPSDAAPLETSVPDHREAVAPDDAGWLVIPVADVPVSELVSSFHEGRSGGRKHRAIDIMAPRGTPVLATEDGTIQKLFDSPAGGLTIYEASAGQAVTYYYAHLDHYADGLHEGVRVRHGMVIGYVGSTGNAPSRAPHLHFAIYREGAGGEWWKGEAVDPFPILVSRGVTVAAP